MTANHLYLSSDGNLYDTRLANWSRQKPLREAFSRGFRAIETTAQLKSALRYGSRSDLGGYPLFFVTSDGAALAFDTVRAELRNVLDSIAHRHSDGWRVVACDVNWEDDSLFDDHTGARIPSAYGTDE